MRLHIPALPHTNTTNEYVWCAYTAKIKKFCTMMTDEGHEVILYSGPENEAKVSEHVEVVTEGQQKLWFGNYNWDTDVFNGFQPDAPWWNVMNVRVINEIKKRAQPGDILGIIAGFCQKPIADVFPEMLPVEWGIGYSGIFSQFRVFESYAWAHHLAKPDDIRLYDTVIPNFFDPKEFSPKTSNGNYLLFLGRHISRKGLPILQEIVRHTDLPVKTAGQGSERIDGAEYLGVVTGQEKAELIAGARALIAPTTYLEPFGGVVVEAHLSGTPTITTDWGAFTETVQNGVNGYRCRTLQEFIDAVNDVEELSRIDICHRAQKYTMGEVAPQFTKYFGKIQTLRSEGWYTLQNN